MPSKQSISAFFLFIFLLSAGQTKAWWDPGHMIVARIGYEQLSSKKKKRADELVAVLEKHYPQVNHFVALGPWPDDLKADGVHLYDKWHYTNIPLNPEGFELPPQPEVDVIWAIRECSKVIASEKAKDIEKARALAFLVHFVGDLHQPLHSRTRYSHEHPDGDRGGNRYDLSGDHRNLHMLWDDGCGLISHLNDIRPYKKPKNPLTDQDLDRVRMVSDSLTQAHPLKSFDNVNNLEPASWAQESAQLAEKFGYDGDQGNGKPLRPGEFPSESYLRNGQEVVAKQLALGGYRLGLVCEGLL